MHMSIIINLIGFPVIVLKSVSGSARRYLWSGLVIPCLRPSSRPGRYIPVLCSTISLCVGRDLIRFCRRADESPLLCKHPVNLFYLPTVIYGDYQFLITVWLCALYLRRDVGRLSSFHDIKWSFYGIICLFLVMDIV